MKNLSVANVSVVEPLVNALNCSETKLAWLFETCGLAPTGVLEASGLAPLHAVESFIAASCQVMGSEEFACHAFDREEARELSSVANIPLKTGSNGYQATLQMISAYDCAASIPLFYTRRSGDTLWLLRRNLGATDPGGSWAVQLFNLRGLLSGMRRIFNGRVAPVALALTPSAPSSLPDDLQHLPISLRRNETGLGYDVTDLARPSIDQRDRLASESRFRPLQMAGPDELRDVICGLLGATRTDQFRKRVALAFGTSERTYLRRLADLGLTHTELLQQARLHIAEDLLRDGTRSVSEIASECGYGNTTDFIRFFRHKQGVTPAVYRNQWGPAGAEKL